MIEENPSPIEINIDDFFFAVGIFGVDMLAKTGKYFDIELMYKRINNSKIEEIMTINMIQCNK